MEASPLGLLDPTSYRVQETANPFVTERNELGREQFLQLLVAQLENQDPLEPQSDAEFIAQLATFSSLEQLMDLNTRIDGVLAGQTQLVNSQALNLIGRDVLVNAEGRFDLSAGRSDEVVFDLTEAKSGVRVKVFDDSGALVRTIDLGAKDSGRHSVVWDGTGEAGQALPPGTYEFNVTAVGPNGDDKSVPAFVSLPVEGIHIGEGGLSLVSGRHVIDFSRILEIRMAGAVGADGEQVAGGEGPAQPVPEPETLTQSLTIS